MGVVIRIGSISAVEINGCTNNTRQSAKAVDGDGGDRSSIFPYSKVRRTKSELHIIIQNDDSSTILIVYGCATCRIGKINGKGFIAFNLSIIDDRNKVTSLTSC